jgi:NADH:ubiquinone oxidoreductase subunit 4 (subunit M)
MAVLAAVGIVISAVYMINMLQRVLPGEPKADQKPWRGLRFIILTFLPK